MVSSHQFWTWNQSKVGWGYYSNRLISSLAPEKCLVSWSPFLAISGAPVFSTLFYIHISVVVEQFETVFPTLPFKIDTAFENWYLEEHKTTWLYLVSLASKLEKLTTLVWTQKELLCNDNDDNHEKWHLFP